MIVNRDEATMIAALIFCFGFILGIVFRIKMVKSIPVDQCIVSQNKIEEFIKANKIQPGVKIQVCVNFLTP